MSILKFKKALLAIFIAASGTMVFGQEGEVTIQQDEKIPALLAMKTQLSKDSKLNDRYKIQLFYGELDGANEVLKEYRAMPYNWTSSIEYETPNYKVWIGNYRNRLEADRALENIISEFPNAFIFKPDRK